MTNNTYPDHTQDQAHVLDQKHGIEHIKEGQEHAYYPYYWDSKNWHFFYYLKSDKPWDRVRCAIFGEAYNYIAKQRSLPGLPYPIVQGIELEEDYYR